MAMIDYGCIVFKDGRFFNQNNFFMNMEDCVGWVDKLYVRYPECDNVRVEEDINDPFSNCTNCERADKENKKDCHGNSIFNRDYLVGNYFCYIGDKDLTIGFYKNSAIITDSTKEIVYKTLGNDVYLNDEKIKRFGPSAKVLRLYFNNTEIIIKKLGKGNVHKLHMRYKGHTYNVIYGYGIDPDISCWNEIKYRYLGKKVAKEIDRYINKFWRYK